jgi:hypothetical protein
MKKILATLLVGSLVVGGVVLVKSASAAATPEGQTCVKMAELCSTDPKASDLDQCVDGMKKLRKMSGDVPFERSRKCIEESQSCAAASGCLMGGVGVGALGEMMKGFGTAVTK